jgi:hypothetical protein
MAWDSLEALVDVHAHFLTDRYVAAARAAGHEKPDGMPGWPVWSADEHLRLMDQWNVETAFLSISSPGVHFGDDAAARVLARSMSMTQEPASGATTPTVTGTSPRSRCPTSRVRLPN